MILSIPQISPRWFRGAGDSNQKTRSEMIPNSYKK